VKNIYENMKYIKEFNDTDWEDWDEEEFDFDNSIIKKGDSVVIIDQKYECSVSQTSPSSNGLYKMRLMDNVGKSSLLLTPQIVQSVKVYYGESYLKLVGKWPLYKSIYFKKVDKKHNR